MLSNSPCPYNFTHGLAERYVCIFKNGLKTVQGNSLDERLAKLLFSYRTTLQTTTSLTPGELMFSRQLKTHFDFMLPNIQDRVEERQVKQKNNFDNRVIIKEHTFEIGDAVYA